MKDEKDVLYALDKSVIDQLNRISLCINACFGVSNEDLKLYKYEEAVEKAKTHNWLMPSADVLYSILKKLLETYDLDILNSKLSEQEQKALRFYLGWEG